MGEEKRGGWKEAAAEGRTTTSGGNGNGNGETPIQNAYCFSYIKRNSGTKTTGEVESYEKSIKDLGDFKTVQGFWRVYNHLVRPNDLPNTLDYHLFKTGIKPMWEDPANRKGGKWMVRVRKGIASRYWEDLVLAIVGEQFDVGNEICGAVVSIRYTEDVISLWNRNADNNEACYRIRDTMRKVLNLPQFVALEYKRHDASLNDSSAPRTTPVWRDQRGGGGERSGNSSGQREGSSGHSGNQDRERERERGSSRFPRDRGDRERSSNNRDNRSRNSNAGESSGRNAWSRDSQRPIFTKTGGDSGESSGAAGGSRGAESKKPPSAPSSSSGGVPNAWQQQK